MGRQPTDTGRSGPVGIGRPAAIGGPNPVSGVTADALIGPGENEEATRQTYFQTHISFNHMYFLIDLFLESCLAFLRLARTSTSYWFRGTLELYVELRPQSGFGRVGVRLEGKWCRRSDEASMRVRNKV